MVFFLFSGRRSSNSSSNINGQQQKNNELLGLLDPLTTEPVDWTAVAHLARKDPVQLQSRDARRDHTPLFLAIQQDGPPFVIRTFLQVYPEAAQEVQRIGLTPLHLAVARGSPPETVHYILEAAPAAASKQMNDGCVPLHFVRNVETARLLITACPMALHIANRASYLPLHRVTYASYASPELLQVMVDAERELLSTNNTPQTCQLVATTAHGISPLDAACEMVERDIRQGQTVCPTAWKKLLILARAVHVLSFQQHTPQQSAPCQTTGNEESILAPPQCLDGDLCMDFSILHVLLQQPNPSFHILRYILHHKHPEQRAFMDRQGRSALVIAASRRYLSRQIICLLCSDPVISTMGAVTGAQGRLPLHLAAASGRRIDGGLEELWKIAPFALTVPDCQTGLHPCLLAALPHDDDDETKGCPGSAKLNTIYCLLRETPWLIPRTAKSDPEAVKRSIRRTNKHELSLTSRILLPLGTGKTEKILIPVVVAVLGWYMVSSYPTQR